MDSRCDSIDRKILNDLSSDAPAVPRIEEEKAEEDSSVAAAPAITTVTVPTPIYQTSSGQYSRWTVCGTSRIWSSPNQMPFCLLWFHESSDWLFLSSSPPIPLNTQLQSHREGPSNWLIMVQTGSRAFLLWPWPMLQQPIPGPQYSSMHRQVMASRYWFPVTR